MNQRWPASFGIGAATHIEHRDIAAVVDELKQITVSRENPNTPAGVCCTVGKGAEYVIGFVSRCDAQGQPHLIAKDLLQLFEVLEEHLWCHVPVGFVIRVRFMAECGFGGIEGNRDTLGLERFAGVQERLQKAIGHTRWPSIFCGQPPFAALAEGVKTAKSQ